MTGPAVTTIHPNLPPVAPHSGSTRSDPARLAAQKAFFALAAGKPPAAAVQASAPAAEIAAAPAQRAAATPAEPGRGPLRPGSILDIRV